MIRSLKALGLALVAVLALSATAAGAAHAQNGKFTSENYPATIDTTLEQEVGSEAEYFEFVGRKFSCEATHFHGTLNEASETLAVMPDYTDESQGGTCFGPFFKVAFTENECSYLFHTAGTASKSYKLELDLVCPAEKLFEIHFVNFSGVPVCTFTMESQALGTLTASNSKEGQITLAGAFTLIGTATQQKPPDMYETCRRT